MNVLQPHHWDIPEQKDEKEEDQTGQDQKSNKDSLLGFNIQRPLSHYCGMQIVEYGTKKIFRNPLGTERSYRPQSEIANLLMKDCSHGDGVSGKKVPNGHSPSPL